MLAVSDMVFVITASLLEGVEQLKRHTDWLPCDHALRHFEPTYSFYYATQSAAVWTVVLVTIERYIAICKPLHAPRYNTVYRYRVAVGIVWIASFLPFFAGIFALRGIENFSDEVYYRYEYITCSVVIFVVPLPLLIILNNRITNAIRQSNVFRQQQLQSRGINDVTMKSNERRSTMLITVVITVFIVCQLPRVGTNIVLLLLYSGLGLRMPDNVKYMLNFSGDLDPITSVLLIINSSINFFLYVAVGRRFRQTFISLFVCRLAN